MAYAELAALRPRAGGEYVYLREAFGPLAAFLTGWTSFVAGFSGRDRRERRGARRLRRPLRAGRRRRDAGLRVPLPVVPLIVSPQALVALASIAALSLVHVRGLGPGRLVQNVLAAIEGRGARRLHRARVRDRARRSSANSRAGAAASPVAGWLLALVPVMFSYSGWNAAAYVAEEIRDPDAQRAAARSALGTLAVVVHLRRC